MDDVAAAAGVGKGTLYRRFGDRWTLLRALIEEPERDFQDELIRGEPPLGPGAPPTERLRAFGAGQLALLERHARFMFAGHKVARRAATATRSTPSTAPTWASCCARSSATTRGPSTSWTRCSRRSPRTSSSTSARSAACRWRTMIDGWQALADAVVATAPRRPAARAERGLAALGPRCRAVARIDSSP